MLSRYLALAYFICLLCSTPGFLRVVYFFGVGYALSIAAQAVTVAVVYRGTLSGWPLVQVLLLFLYGARLGSYLILRDQGRGYRAREARRAGKRPPVGAVAKAGIWIGVAALYVLLGLPVFLTLSAEAAGQPLATLPAGLLLMTFGLVLESVADWQKYRFKLAYPGRFCDTGLYRLVRCPNYLGEMLFWSGVWLSAATAYGGWLEWLLCTLGFVSVLGIMISATRRLEAEQAEHYGAERAYATYRRTVPVLFPFVPLYSLRRPGTGAS
jgi:steroid 5-alpha reductase family enzyme